LNVIIAVEDGHAYSLSEDNWLEYLEMRAAGGTAGLYKYSIGIGSFGADVTHLERDAAFRMAAAVRVALASDKAA
jgi:hypothetical protein